MSDTMYALTTWRERNGLRPLREIAKEQATRLREVHAPVPARTIRETRRAEFAAQVARKVQAAPVAVTRPAPVGTPVETRESKRERFARLDAMAAAIPDGWYALPRRPEAGEGQSIYFFVIKGNRISMVTGGVGDFMRHPMSTTYQEVALTKIGADVRAAASLFGQKTSTCGFCAAQGRVSPLTKDRSVAAGYGEHCAKKHGLPW